MFPLRHLTSSVLIFSLLTPFLNGSFVPISAKNPHVDETGDETGLQFRLSHGVKQPETGSATKPATASELSQSEIETVLKRLPPMKAEPSGEFAPRENSLPPPRTGNRHSPRSSPTCRRPRRSCSFHLTSRSNPTTRRSRTPATRRRR